VAAVISLAGFMGFEAYHDFVPHTRPAAQRHASLEFAPQILVTQGCRPPACGGARWGFSVDVGRDCGSQLFQSWEGLA
jgi:hypothetical protein